MDLQCEICLIKFEQDSLLLSHINIHLGRKCEICLQPFTSELTTNPNNAKCRDSHIWLASQAKRPESDSLSEAPPLEMISTVHDKQFYPYPQNKMVWQCQYCDYKTVIKSSLSKHMRYCLQSTIVSKSFFVSKTFLIEHTQTKVCLSKVYGFSHPVIIIPGPYLCKECGRRFTVHCNLKQHIQSMHIKDKPYKCIHCGLGFIRKDKLREHQRIHTGEKPYQCTHCKQKFARKQSLNKHIKMHIGWKCRFCSKIFESESQLKSHKTLMHKGVDAETGTKWFEFGCNLCQKRFYTQDLLRKHVKLHNAFPCDKCLYIFEEEEALKQHNCNGFKSVIIQTAEPLKCLQDKIKKEKEAQLIIQSKQFHCVECDRYFKSGQSLGGHRARVHSQKRSSDNQKSKKSAKRKKKQKKKAKPKKEKESVEGIENDQVEGVIEIEEQNELDILVGRRLKKNENEIGVDIFGEYASNNNKEAEEIKQPNKKKIKRKKKVIEMMEPLKDCPARHGLVKQLTPDNRVFECDECNKTMYLNEWMYGWLG